VARRDTLEKRDPARGEPAASQASGPAREAVRRAVRYMEPVPGTPSAQANVRVYRRAVTVRTTHPPDPRHYRAS
jgi:hypothetical protein